MLVGTFALANNGQQVKSFNLNENKVVESVSEFSTDVSVEYIKVSEDCTWTKFIKVTTIKKYFLGIKISENTTTEEVWICI